MKKLKKMVSMIVMFYYTGKLMMLYVKQEKLSDKIAKFKVQMKHFEEGYDYYN